MVQLLANRSFATVAAAILLFLCTLASVPTVTCAQENDGEERFEPRELARELRAEICASNVTQIQEFYKRIIEEESRNVTYPDQSTKITYSERYTAGNTPSRRHVIPWSVLTRRSVLPFLSKQIAFRDSITWCIYLLSMTGRHHGCINATSSRSTPGFKALGFPETMSLTNGSIMYQGSLELAFDNAPYLSVLEGALILCNILLPDATTVGLYFNLELNLEKYSEWIDGSKQRDAFLIEGEPKHFTCLSIAITLINDFKWFLDGEVIDRVYFGVKEGCFTLNIGVNENCSDIEVYQYSSLESEGSLRNCKNDYTEKNRGLVTYILNFSSPSVNDTGEYVCKKYDGAVGTTIRIAVVFTKLPPKQNIFDKGSPGLLICEMKAPSDSIVYWSHTQEANWECLIPILNSNNVSSPIDIEACNTTAAVSQTKDLIDDEFSLFHLELKIPEVTSNHQGVYFCSVEYAIWSMTNTELIQQTATLFIKNAYQGTPKVNLGGEGMLIVGVVVGTFIFCLFIGTIIAILFMLWVHHILRSKRKGRRRLPISVRKHQVYDKLSLNSPWLEKLQNFEFPRTNLELQEVLGKGRFGKVFKGKAHGIVPHLPNLNTVAIKTAITVDQLHSCTQQILSELEIMTKISPHANICNLLASCTSTDGPVYIIMEYAHHGNLKDYLEHCKISLLQRDISIHVGTEEECSNLQLKSCSQPQHFRVVPADSPISASDTVHLTAYPPTLSPTSDPRFTSGYDHLTSSQPDTTGVEGESTTVSCGLITELNICDMAHQIVSGLQHLENMNIVHCDLAARNILIAENFILKIGDFGLARDTASTSRYQSNTDVESMIAVKWAAPEFLEDHAFSFKSDVWSFATVIWEIATYGAKPFSDVTIGASLDAFIQHLKKGSRPPQPKGLSDSIYKELCSCWSTDPAIRPDCTSLLDYFEFHAQSQDPQIPVNRAQFTII